MATSVLLLNLNKLQADADYIFHGQCISNHVTEDTTLGLATYTTFKVIQAIKGSLSETYTIKQFGGASTNSASIVVVPGVPQFEIGKKYVLFLPKPSHLGFSSPVGLTQGMFTEIPDKEGEINVSNGRDFSELLLNVPITSPGTKLLRKSIPRSLSKENNTTSPGSTRMPLDKFLSIVKEMERQP